MDLLPEDKNNSQLGNGELEHNVRYHHGLNDSLDGNSMMDKAQITLLESNGTLNDRNISTLSTKPHTKGIFMSKS